MLKASSPAVADKSPLSSKFSKTYGSRNASDSNPLKAAVMNFGASIGTSYRNSKDMSVPLENDELKMRTENRTKERQLTGGFRA